MSEQGTAEWHMERLGRVTASKISDVMMAKTTAGYQNYMAQLVCERLTGNPTDDSTSVSTDWMPNECCCFWNCNCVVKTCPTHTI
jgi:hypothetical protein